jgi:hypothetical protein
VLVFGAGPIGMGVLGAAGTLPPLLFGLVAGVWVDRVRRRPMLIAADLARAALLVSIPIAWWAGALSLPYLAVVAFLVGTCTVVFDVAHASYLPVIVPREQLVDANSKFEVSEAVTQFTGPGVGGILVQLLTAPLAIAVDAASFVASAVLIGRIRHPEPPAAERTEGRRVVGEVAEGLAITLRHPLLRATTAYGATTQLFMSALLALYVLYLVNELGLEPVLVGASGMAAAPGTLLGAWIVGPAVRHLGLGVTMALGALLPGIGGP